MPATSTLPVLDPEGAEATVVVGVGVAVELAPLDCAPAPPSSNTPDRARTPTTRATETAPARKDVKRLILMVCPIAARGSQAFLKPCSSRPKGSLWGLCEG